MDHSITNEFARADSNITGQHDAAPSGEVAFATGTITLGTVLVARSVCAMLIGSEVGELTADLAARFPENALVRDDRKLEGDLQKILRFIENPAAGLDLVGSCCCQCLRGQRNRTCNPVSSCDQE